MKSGLKYKLLKKCERERNNKTQDQDIENQFKKSKNENLRLSSKIDVLAEKIELLKKQNTVSFE